jgi:peptidoglycan/LPS O-acetylase OafA/YrhL
VAGKEIRSKEIRSKEIRALTGLRGAAEMMVVLYHADINFGPVLGRIVRHGYLAVDLFFVLSGYVMALTYGHMFRNGGNRGAYRDFLLLRFGRIYPLYFAVTIVCVLAFGLFAHKGGGELIASNLLLVQGWGIDNSIIGPGWSISTEAGAYLLFPPLALLCLHRGWRGAALWAVICAAAIPVIAWQATAVLGQCLRNGPLDVFGKSLYPLLRCLAEFSLGMLIWRVAGSPSGAPFRHPWAGDALTLAICLALLVHGADVLIVGLFVLVIPALAAGSSHTAKWLAARPLHWLGVISYSLYLVHVPFLDAESPRMLRLLTHFHLPHLVSVANALLIPLIILLAYLTYSLIERPGRVFVRRLAARRPAPVAVEAAAPADI